MPDITPADHAAAEEIAPLTFTTLNSHDRINAIAAIIAKHMEKERKEINDCAKTLQKKSTTFMQAMNMSECREERPQHALRFLRRPAMRHKRCPFVMQVEGPLRIGINMKKQVHASSAFIAMPEHLFLSLHMDKGKGRQLLSPGPPGQEGEEMKTLAEAEDDYNKAEQEELFAWERYKAALAMEISTGGKKRAHICTE